MTRFNLQEADRSVHPRARGEHPVKVGASDRSVGSSPRSRGTCGVYQWKMDVSRFIPALAGNIYNLYLKIDWTPVHPRARGEHTGLMATPQAPIGSSPRSRGTSGQSNGRRVSSRFIPALAGNMHWRKMESGQYDGSSPRSRGTYGLINQGRV